jgi:hypothetical protein|tara:strand:+ start:152 stop:979 length:828 start_codon:yes stop_codon:yes gene_type:complete
MGVGNSTFEACGGVRSPFTDQEVANISFAPDHGREGSSPSFSRAAHRFSAATLSQSFGASSESPRNSNRNSRTPSPYPNKLSHSDRNLLANVLKNVLPFDHLNGCRPNSPLDTKKHNNLDLIIGKYFELVEKVKDEVIIQPGAVWKYYHVVLTGQLKAIPHTYRKKTKSWEPNTNRVTHIHPIADLNNCVESNGGASSPETKSMEGNGAVEWNANPIDLDGKTIAPSSTATGESVIQWSFGDAAIWGRSKAADEQIVAVKDCRIVRMKADIYRGL